MTTLVLWAALQSSTDARFDPARLALLRTRMQEFADGRGVAGIVVGLNLRGKTVMVEGWGQADLAKRQPMKPDTIFQVMSMTKPMTAVAAMILVERGLLRLQDPVSLYLPEFAKMRLADGTEARSPIRIRHLMTHTSGIDSDMPISDEDRASLTLRAFIEIVAKQPLATEPGTAERYSGPAISTLGRVIEVISRRTFEDFVDAEICKPLGLRDTHLFLPTEKRERLAQAYVREDGKLTVSPYDPARVGTKFANPAGGLYSTAADMLKWHQAQLDALAGRPSIISAATARLMTSIQGPSTTPGASSESGWGLGWSVVRGTAPSRAYLPPGSFGHSGALETYGWADPENQVCGVYLSQVLGGSGRESEIFRTMTYAALRRD